MLFIQCNYYLLLCATLLLEMNKTWLPLFIVLGSFFSIANVTLMLYGFTWVSTLLYIICFVIRAHWYLHLLLWESCHTLLAFLLSLPCIVCVCTFVRFLLFFPGSLVFLNGGSYSFHWMWLHFNHVLLRTSLGRLA